jgi:hypothetical protein
MTPLVKKKLVWFVGAVTALLLLYLGFAGGGLGPCGPGSPIGFVCLFGLPVALLFAIITFALLVGAFIRERKREKDLPASPPKP